VRPPPIPIEYWQSFHNYNIVGEGTFNSRKAIIIGVTPISHESDAASNISVRNWLMSGRVWIDANDQSVLKIEMDKCTLKDDWKIEEKARR
jgi:hypothetical protein